jgi:N-acetylmuramoyl-L-alanine amidase
MSPNHDERPVGAVIDMLVLHYTGMESAEAAIDRLCDPQAKVSAHYVIHEDGCIVQLVSEERRAWHAGVAFWRGNTDINARSIGIEMVNPGHEFGLKPFPEKQVSALEILVLDILQRHPLPGRNVVAHSDVAPRRKVDPGELFDWSRLYKCGIGFWPKDGQCDGMNEQQAGFLLRDFGYETDDLGKTLEAFQRHFRPGEVNGKLDSETVQLLSGLAQ